MAYSIIQPPFTVNLRDMSKKELKEYFDWFMRTIPERVAVLAKAVQQTPGFENWQPDCTPVSLDVLGNWYAASVETRKRSPEELEKIKSKLAFPMDVPDYELTGKTLSLAMDVGMYLSQVFLKNHPSLGWEQDLSTKKSVHYGQPVLTSFEFGPFGPVHMMVTMAHGFAGGKKTGKTLRDIYDIWSKKIAVPVH
jgi:hypothetical protein